MRQQLILALALGTIVAAQRVPVVKASTTASSLISATLEVSSKGSTTIATQVKTSSTSTPTEYPVPLDPNFYDLEVSDKLAAVENQKEKIVKIPYKPSISAAAIVARTPGYVFNASARDNVVVYFGQTPGTNLTNLTNQCNDPAVDIVVLGFIRVADGAMGYPNISFGSTCGTQTAAMKANAPGLLNCKYLAPQISYCQSIGKKVFVSLGGSVSNITLNSDSQAISFATRLWDLFGSGTGEDWNLRPFGNVSIDGFDLDNETKDNGSRYGLFATTMRSLYASYPAKTFYLSATMTCTWNGGILTTPLAYMEQADFIWPRFYNNLKCNLNTGYFFNGTTGNPGGLDWWNNWASSLGPSGPKVYIGSLGYQTTGSGYLPPDNFAFKILSARNESNLGGVMIWDGTQAHITTNVAGDMDFIQVVKAALTQ